MLFSSPGLSHFKPDETFDAALAGIAKEKTRKIEVSFLKSMN
jgi:hypothetical protein